MMIKTPTSCAITHCLLPQPPDPSTMSLTVSPEVSITHLLNALFIVSIQSVQAGHEIVIKWQVPFASQKDHIGNHFVQFICY